MAFLADNCTFCELTSKVLADCRPFSCGNDDLDDFFANDATRYAQFLMGKTYCFRLNSDPSKLVCALTLSNDSIRIYDLPRAPGFAFSDIAPCATARGVLNYRRFRELMPSVGLYSESRPDGTHAWSAWDPLGPGSEIHR